MFHQLLFGIDEVTDFQADLCIYLYLYLYLSLYHAGAKASPSVASHGSVESGGMFGMLDTFGARRGTLSPTRPQR